MKKTLSLFIAIIMLIPLLTLTGCGVDEVEVESTLTIDSDFSGQRSIVLKFPRNIKIDSFKDKLLENNPFKDSKTSKFEYIGVEEDGYTFVMDIVFSSRDDYLSQVQTLINHDVTSYLSVTDTVLTQGIRVVEDFDVSELIGWIVALSEEDENLKKVEYSYSKNVVSFDDKEYKTGTTVDISTRDGYPINSITIETTNLKSGRYDRTITFSIPNQTYMGQSEKIEEYFMSNTMPVAHYCDFTSVGSSWEYKVIYKDLSLEIMSLYTSKLLDSDYSDIYYGDKNNNSTPLSEGLVFEESLDTFSFINADGECVDLVYKYSLPVNTTHGEGKVYTCGSWNHDGAWKDGVYTLVVDSDSMTVRVPDGIQYSINGIRFNLEVVGKDNFVRTTEFLYSKTQGYDGMAFAKEYFERKGAKVETDEDKDNMICRVVCSGTSEQISTQLETYFGSGNSMSYELSDKFFSLSEKTLFTESIDLSHILNSSNASRPMTYTVSSDSGEEIHSLYSSDSMPVVSKDAEVLTINIGGGRGSVSYNGNIPKTWSIVIYCFIAVAMLLITIYVIVQLLSYQRFTLPQTDSKIGFVPSLQQTTTFNIAELNMLSDIDDIDFDDLDDKISFEDDEKSSIQKEQEKFEFLHKMMTPESEESTTPVESIDDSSDKKDKEQYEEEYFYNV